MFIAGVLLRDGAAPAAVGEGNGTADWPWLVHFDIAGEPPLDERRRKTSSRLPYGQPTCCSNQPGQKVWSITRRQEF
jgi:hypothetical protein